MLRVLITGAAGFLGTNLSLHYLSQGWEVVGVDDHSSSIGPNSPNVVTLGKFGSFELYEASITDDSIFERLRDEYRSFDLILNFACPASPPRYMKMPIHTMMTCTLGLQNILEFSLPYRCPIVHASTSEVYGDAELDPQPESYWGNVNPYGPRGCYDNGKRAGESICYDYRNKYDSDVKVIRIFNTFGPCMDANDGRVVSNFICQALRNEDLTIYGDGKQTRSFCYVDDLVDGISRVAASTRDFSGPVNLGNPDEFTMLELAEKVLEVVPDSTSKIVFRPLPKDDPRQRRPDITLARNAIGWEPKVSLLAGLYRSVGWFEQFVTKKA